MKFIVDEQSTFYFSDLSEESVDRYVNENTIVTPDETEDVAFQRILDRIVQEMPECENPELVSKTCTHEGSKMRISLEPLVYVEVPDLHCRFRCSIKRHTIDLSIEEIVGLSDKIKEPIIINYSNYGYMLPTIFVYDTYIE